MCRAKIHPREAEQASDRVLNAAGQAISSDCHFGRDAVDGRRISLLWYLGQFRISSSFRKSGSPPVKRILRPSRPTAMPTRRSVSSPVSSHSQGNRRTPSSGMHYARSRRQASVTQTPRGLGAARYGGRQGAAVDRDGDRCRRSVRHRRSCVGSIDLVRMRCPPLNEGGQINSRITPQIRQEAR
jgi:hypothetical protein